MKKLSTLLAAALVIVMASCSEDEDPIIGGDNNNTGNELINSNITTNTTWTNDKVYQLQSRIIVEKKFDVQIINQEMLRIMGIQ